MRSLYSNTDQSVIIVRSDSNVCIIHSLLLNPYVKLDPEAPPLNAATCRQMTLENEVFVPQEASTSRTSWTKGYFNKYSSFATQDGIQSKNI